MKDIKSIMIGFLLATCMFLFMGQTKATNSEQGKYQGFSDPGGWLYLTDTTTGELWHINTRMNPKHQKYTYWISMTEANQFYSSKEDFKKINDK